MLYTLQHTRSYPHKYIQRSPVKLRVIHERRLRRRGHQQLAHGIPAAAEAPQAHHRIQAAPAAVKAPQVRICGLVRLHTPAKMV